MIYIDVNTVAFSIGPINISWYGIMIALAVITLVAWALLSIKKDPRLSYNTVINAALVGIPSGVIFSRFLHVVDLWDYYSQNPWEIIGGEGLTIWGAVLGAAIGIWLFSLINKKFSFGHLADVAAPGIIGVPVHPTQIYEIIFNLIVFGILFKLRRRLKPDGSLFLVYLSLYSLWRLGIDFIRDGTSFLFGLHQAQVISIVVLVITIPLLVIKTRFVRKETVNEVDLPA
jgi:phosphatidylglycerol:prolipoprotein diacylglycerol transferase